MNALTHSRPWLMLGWSMIHFLWVGGAVLVAAGVLRLLLQRAAPNIRYAVALVTFVVLIASPGVVATLLAPRSLADQDAAAPEIAPPAVNVPNLPAGANDGLSRPPRPSEPLHTGSVAPALDLAAVESLTRRAGLLAAAYLPWLWLAGFPIAAIYLLAGISGAGRLRRRARPATEQALLATLDRLAAELGVKGRAAIGLSVQVVAPLVVGIARPMILLPPVLLAAWSPEELELILLHELAHVRRCDNLVNLLQRIAEAALFFHPAVWIVSRWVRLEREQCCDEIVLHHREAPQKYAETLAALAVPGISPAHAAAAMANHQLVARIRNILNVEDRTMRFSTRSLLAALGSIALLVGLFFVAGPLAADDKPAPASSPSSSSDDDKEHKPLTSGAEISVNSDGGPSATIKGQLINTPVEVLWTAKDASGSLAANVQKRLWGPEQACGAPDTSEQGDCPTAWASATPDGQREWLDVDFGESIDGVALVVYENNAPGAIDRLWLLDAKGGKSKEHEVKDQTPKTLASGVSVFPLVANMHGVRIELDSENVPGWNEIDAVGLLDKKGQMHWAKTAKASSTFADVGDAVQVNQLQAYYSGDVVQFRPLTLTASGRFEADQGIANDPEIARLRKCIEEIEQGLRGIANTGDAAQQELAKKRIRRAELRKSLLNEEIEERVAQLRQQFRADLSRVQVQLEFDEKQAAAQRARAAEQEARANAAKAVADRAQAQAQLQAATDANRKLRDELAALQQQEAAALKALKEQDISRQSRVQDYHTKLQQNKPAVEHFDARAIVTAKGTLDTLANKLGAELKELDAQGQGATEPIRAQKLLDELKGIESTLQQLDKSLQDETTRTSARQESLRTNAATAFREDRQALERIEQLEKAVQELRREQQGNPDPSKSPGHPRR